MTTEIIKIKESLELILKMVDFLADRVIDRDDTWAKDRLLDLEHECRNAIRNIDVDL